MRKTWLQYLDRGANGRSVLRRYMMISELRREPVDSARLRQDVFDNDRWVAIYCAKRLQALPTVAQPGEDLDELRRYRDLDTVDGEVRIWVTRLACFLDGQEAPYDEEYAWVQHALANSEHAEVEQLETIADDLAMFPERIDESARFLASLARDSKKRHVVRLAAIHPFYAHVFEDCGARKLSASKELFDAWEALLLDEDIRLRVAAPRLLWQYCDFAMDKNDAKGQQSYARRALTAMKDPESRGYKNDFQDARAAIEALLDQKTDGNE